jgi:tRNA-2-methylthio-N6-dimethylallyladenosine synthase
MNRKHTREHYLDVIKKIRSVRPQIAIGTDIIVGFSGETEEQFAETISMYKECDFDIAYPAQYSVRSGTLAVKLYTDDVPKEVKKERWERLQKLMEDRTYEKNQEYLGRDTSILVDTWRDGWLEGNSREMKRVRIKGVENLVGKILRGKIFKTDTWMMWAE